MKEQLISFETAKLAKEKGFPHCDGVSAYDEDGDIVNSHTKVAKYSAPTQSLLQKWLREEKEIYITCLPDYDDEATIFTCSIHFKRDEILGLGVKILRKNGTINYWATFEEALEKGLKEALKLIK